MPTSDILTVQHLNAGYGKRQVLFDVNFSIKQGDIVLLIGGNGSGKSTLLKAIYGLADKWQTEHTTSIHFQQQNITHLAPHQLIKTGIVYVPQKNNSFDQLTVDENLDIAAISLNNKTDTQKHKTHVYQQLPKLAALKNRTPFHLSGGEKQQLALGMALMLNPKMILLDEPSAGLAPNTWQKNLALIKQLNEQGITFIIVEHRIKETLANVHQVLRMRLGTITQTTEPLS